MARTPWEMAAVGKEFSHQTALMAWAAWARLAGAKAANDPLCYTKLGHLVTVYATVPRKEIDLGLAHGNATLAIAQFPNPLVELKWLHAIKNQGHGDRIRGARSAAEGLRPGVFDLFLPVPRPVWYNEEERGGYNGAYCGLYIELKAPDRINHKNGGASDEQLEFQADMRAAGYAAEIVHGWEAARDCLLTYLGKSPAT